MPPKLVVCTRCLDTVTPKRVTPGSILVELVLWLCFILPGLIYSAWRLSARHWACPSCWSKELVPLESEAAKRIRDSRARR